MTPVAYGVAALGRWKRERAALEDRLETARSFDGLSAAAAAQSGGAQIRRGERLFLVMERAALIEPKGSAVDAAHPLDRGTFTITDRRAVFEGAERTREWSFAKLVEHRHYDRRPTTMIEVANRKRISGVAYESAHATDVRFYFDLALAHHAGTLDAFESELERQVLWHEARKPSVHARAWNWRGWAQPIPALSALVTALVVAAAIIVGSDGSRARDPRVQEVPDVLAVEESDATVGTDTTATESPAVDAPASLASIALARDEPAPASTSPSAAPPTSTPAPPNTCTGLVVVGPISIPSLTCDTPNG